VVADHLFSAFPMTTIPFTCFVKVAFPHQGTKSEDYWLQVYDCWMIISKKLGAPGHFIIPLDLQPICSGEKEDGGFQNSLFIETSQKSGGHKLYLVSTNRIETIQLFRAINAGWTVFKDSIQGRTFPAETVCEYDVPSRFMSFSRDKRRLALTADRLTVGDSKSYTLDSIVSMSAKQNDQACSSQTLNRKSQFPVTDLRPYATAPPWMTPNST
jgi:hypothetical protein